MYTFTIHIWRQFLTSSKTFDTIECAEKALNDYLEMTHETFPKAKADGFVHKA